MKKETRELLKERASRMARVPEAKTEMVASGDFIIFSLGAESYGILSSLVREVYPLKDYTPIPVLPPYFLGLIQVRRQILPVIDLKKLLHLPDRGLGELNKVLILDDGKMEFGILADVVLGTEEINFDRIMSAPPTIAGAGIEFLMGVTKERLILLDAAKLLGDQRLIVDDQYNQ